MSIRVIIGDVREKLADLPDESVHCVVTSPPYFGLRDYGTASWEGGDPACDHLGPPMRTNAKPSDQVASFHGGTSRANEPMGKSCNKCGATRTDKQIGLEPTPAEFVAVMVEVFREVRRVLRKDGTLWLNLGDSYAAGPMTQRESAGERSGGTLNGRYGHVDNAVMAQRRAAVPVGLKAKDLLGIPWRVAFALQADGWYLRQDIIWAKPNPMPESVTDRCTKAHEYLFLLSKSARYHYDAEAIREEAEYGYSPTPMMFDGVGDAKSAPTRKTGAVQQGDGGTRNRRSVWTVATQAFSAAHFATFPPALIEPCIKAGCPKGGTVLDPFGGAGTTGLVADRLQRDAILIELNPAYAAMMTERIADDAPLFAVLL